MNRSFLALLTLTIVAFGSTAFAAEVVITPVGGEVRVNRYTAGDQTELRTSARQGAFAAVWLSDRRDTLGERSGIQLSARVFGNGAGREFSIVRRDPGVYLQYPSVVGSAEGYLAIWNEGAGIWARRLSTEGRPVGRPFSLRGSDGAVVAAAVGADDSIVLVSLTYLCAEECYQRAVAWVHGAAGEPLSGPIRITEVSRAPATHDQSVSVASDEAGRVSVAWAIENPLEPDGAMALWTRRFTVAPLRLEAGRQLADGVVDGAVSSSPSGKRFATWLTWTGDGASMLWRELTSRGRGLRQRKVVAASDRSLLRPAIAVGPTGHSVVAWSSFLADTSGWDVRCRAFAADGSRSEIVIVNGLREGFQDKPRIAMTDADTFVVTWESLGADGGWDLFARYFRLQAGTLESVDQ